MIEMCILFVSAFLMIVGMYVENDSILILAIALILYGIELKLDEIRRKL